MAFTGFTEKGKQFLVDLKENNNKEWFDENRKTYEKELREKAKSFVSDAGRLFAENGIPYLADNRRSLFRINRDIRFSKDKSPYKTNIGMFFPYTIKALKEKPVCAVGLYLHFSYDECFIGGGVHTPPPKHLKAIRERISEDYDEFLDIINDEIFKKEFPIWWDSEKLKSAPRGFDKDDPAIEYLKQKMFTVTTNIDFEQLYDENLLELLLYKAKVLEPFVEFINTAIEGIE